MAGRVQQDAFIDDSDESWSVILLSYLTELENIRLMVQQLVPCAWRSSTSRIKILDRALAAIK